MTQETTRRLTIEVATRRVGPDALEQIQQAVKGAKSTLTRELEDVQRKVLEAGSSKNLSGGNAIDALTRSAQEAARVVGNSFAGLEAQAAQTLARLHTQASTPMMAPVRVTVQGADQIERLRAQAGTPIVVQVQQRVQMQQQAQFASTGRAAPLAGMDNILASMLQQQAARATVPQARPIPPMAYPVGLAPPAYPVATPLAQVAQRPYLGTPATEPVLTVPLDLEAKRRQRLIEADRAGTEARRAQERQRLIESDRQVTEARRTQEAARLALQPATQAPPAGDAVGLATQTLLQMQRVTPTVVAAPPTQPVAPAPRISQATSAPPAPTTEPPGFRQLQQAAQDASNVLRSQLVPALGATTQNAAVAASALRQTRPTQLAAAEPRPLTQLAPRDAPKTQLAQRDAPKTQLAPRDAPKTQLARSDAPTPKTQFVQPTPVTQRERTTTLSPATSPTPATPAASAPLTQQALLLGQGRPRTTVPTTRVEPPPAPTPTRPEPVRTRAETKTQAVPTVEIPTRKEEVQALLQGKVMGAPPLSPVERQKLLAELRQLESGKPPTAPPPAPATATPAPTPESPRTTVDSGRTTKVDPRPSAPGRVMDALAGMSEAQASTPVPASTPAVSASEQALRATLAISAGKSAPASATAPTKDAERAAAAAPMSLWQQIVTMFKSLATVLTGQLGPALAATQKNAADAAAALHTRPRTEQVATHQVTVAPTPARPATKVAGALEGLNQESATTKPVTRVSRALEKIADDPQLGSRPVAKALEGLGEEPREKPGRRVSRKVVGALAGLDEEPAPAPAPATPKPIAAPTPKPAPVPRPAPTPSVPLPEPVAPPGTHKAVTKVVAAVEGIADDIVKSRADKKIVKALDGVGDEIDKSKVSRKVRGALDGFVDDETATKRTKTPTKIMGALEGLVAPEPQPAPVPRPAMAPTLPVIPQMTKGPTPAPTASWQPEPQPGMGMGMNLMLAQMTRQGGGPAVRPAPTPTPSPTPAAPAPAATTPTAAPAEDKGAFQRLQQHVAATSVVLAGQLVSALAAVAQQATLVAKALQVAMQPATTPAAPTANQAKDCCAATLEVLRRIGGHVEQMVRLFAGQRPGGAAPPATTHGAAAGAAPTAQPAPNATAAPASDVKTQQAKVRLEEVQRQIADLEKERGPDAVKARAEGMQRAFAEAGQSVMQLTRGLAVLGQYNSSIEQMARAFLTVQAVTDTIRGTLGSIAGLWNAGKTFLGADGGFFLTGAGQRAQALAQSRQLASLRGEATMLEQALVPGGAAAGGQVAASRATQAVAASAPVSAPAPAPVATPAPAPAASAAANASVTGGTGVAASGGAAAGGAAATGTGTGVAGGSSMAVTLAVPAIAAVVAIAATVIYGNRYIQQMLAGVFYGAPMQESQRRVDSTRELVRYNLARAQMGAAPERIEEEQSRRNMTEAPYLAQQREIETRVRGLRIDAELEPRRAQATIMQERFSRSGREYLESQQEDLFRAYRQGLPSERPAALARFQAAEQQMRAAGERARAETPEAVALESARRQRDAQATLVEEHRQRTAPLFVERQDTRNDHRRRAELERDLAAMRAVQGGLNTATLDPLNESQNRGALWQTANWATAGVNRANLWVSGLWNGRRPEEQWGNVGALDRGVNQAQQAAQGNQRARQFLDGFRDSPGEPGEAVPINTTGRAANAARQAGESIQQIEAEIARLNTRLTSTMTQRERASGQQVQMQQQLVQYEEQLLAARRAHNERQIANLREQQQYVEQARRAQEALARSFSDQTVAARRQLAGMQPHEQMRALNIARRFRREGANIQLAPEEMQFIQGQEAFRDVTNQILSRRADRSGIPDEVLRELGRPQQQAQINNERDRLQRIEVTVRQQVEVLQAQNAQQIAEQVNQNLVPAMDRLGTDIGRQLGQAMRALQVALMAEVNRQLLEIRNNQPR